MQENPPIKAPDIYLLVDMISLAVLMLALCNGNLNNLNNMTREHKSHNVVTKLKYREMNGTLVCFVMYELMARRNVDDLKTNFMTRFLNDVLYHYRTLKI
jgi:hypothetical protein